jgi:hypothetical protein
MAPTVEQVREWPQHVTMLSCPQRTPCVFRFENSSFGIIVVVDSAIHCETCRAQIGATVREAAGGRRSHPAARVSPLHPADVVRATWTRRVSRGVVR